MAAARRGAGPRRDALTDRANLLSPFLAGSTIYALRPMFHLMLEHVLLFEPSFDGVGQSRDTLYTLSPGLFAAAGTSARRRSSPARRCRSRGAAAATDTGVFLYFSYELPFIEEIRRAQLAL